MRLWSLHPRYLDTQGLVALWREGLLAQKVLSGKTQGYKHHPQLERFKAHWNPQAAIATYLLKIWKESCRRGYCFDPAKIGKKRTGKRIPVAKGQLKYEFNWLCYKLEKRSPEKYRKIKSSKKILPHPFFKVIPGNIERWEKIR